MNIFARKSDPHKQSTGRKAGGVYNGFGAPLQVVYGFREAALNDPGAAAYAYLTLLLPRYTPIGGGIPNQRDIGCAPPSWSAQGVGLTRLGDPGIIAGAFVSGPLTNVTSMQLNLPVGNPAAFDVPAGGA